MMLIITSPNPKEAVDWLVENTNKNFCFKQLLELGQLICSTYISDVYKPVKQGRELQIWIENNIEWVFYYYDYLFHWCKDNIKMQQRTITRMQEIRADLFTHCQLMAKKHKCIYHGHRIGFDIEIRPIDNDIINAIFRYKQDYECEYESNSELPIDECCEQYKMYLKWKFSV